MIATGHSPATCAWCWARISQAPLGPGESLLGRYVAFLDEQEKAASPSCPSWREALGLEEPR